MTAALTVRAITPAEHLAHVRSVAVASYLQCPSWGVMPPRWVPESVGFFAGPDLVGSALVLLRRLPVVGALAYVGEGPVLDWAGLGPARVLDALLTHLRAQGVFSVKLAPDVVRHRWVAATLRSVARTRPDGVARLRDLPPDEVDPVGAQVVDALHDGGWTQYEAPGPGFGGQMHPRYRSHVPLAPDTDPAERLDTQWRRNLRRAAASGVEVRTGDADDLGTFVDLYAETAGRDGFPPLPPEFFERMWASLRAEDPTRIDLYLATREGRAYAAALRTRVGRTVSYTFGASGAAGREWRPSNAMQWRMLTDAHAQGADVYDLRGISDTLDERDPLHGLLRFKTGLGGDAVEVVGEWDFALRPLRHRAVTAYLERRAR